MYKNITGVILAGGKSKRMEENKSFLIWKEKPIIEIMISKMKEIFEEITLITNEKKLYEKFELPMFSDIYSGGPLAGIHSALIHSVTDKIFVISCDMPLVKTKTIQFILENSNTENLTIPYANGFMQHLCGVYSKQLLPEIEKLLSSSDKLELNDKKPSCKMGNLFGLVSGKKLNLDTDYSNLGKDEFLNLNTKEDYEVLKEYF